VRRYVVSGAWRTDTIVDDLYRVASTTPDATAIVARRGDVTSRLRWGAYVAAADWYAGACDG
jgi:hypothetical protein